MFDILPGVLEKEWGGIEKKLETVKPFAKAIHVDLLDGKFAPNTTWLDPAPFAKYSQDFLLELHMMVEEPVKYLQAFADAGFRRFVGHIEKMSDQAEFIAEAEMLGEAALGIDAGTSIDAIKVPLDDLDSILVMTVKAGFSGQSFMAENLEKVKKLANMTTIPIEIDGGVNDETMKLGCAAGASRFVATSYLYGAEKPEEKYQLLEKILKDLKTPKA